MGDTHLIDHVNSGIPVVQAAPAALLVRAEPLFACESGAVGGTDMDAVHDMRVASRRVREALLLFEPLYPRKRHVQVLTLIRSVTRALGPVRDSDVFINAFRRMPRYLDEGGKRAVAFVVGYRLAQREAELVTMRRRLGQLNLADERSAFMKFVREPKRRVSGAYRFGDFAHSSVVHGIERVYSHLPEALVEQNIEAQHDMRVSVKQLRYAVEVFAPCYGPGFETARGALVRMQDVLGHLHDLHVFLDMVADPAMIARARHATVQKADFDGLIDLLNRRAHTRFVEFSRVIALYPRARVEELLLAPLDLSMDVSRPGSDAASSRPGQSEQEAASA